MTSQPLREGVDYYLDRGMFVLTADFLRRRGYCCGNGCRHCPYNKEQAKPDEPADLTPQPPLRSGEGES